MDLFGEDSIGIAEGVFRAADAVGVADAGRKLSKIERPPVPALLRVDAIFDGNDGLGEEERGWPKPVINEKGFWATGGD